MTEWQTIDTAPIGERVIVWAVIPGLYERPRRIIAKFWPAFTLPAHDDVILVETGPDGEAYMEANWYIDAEGFDPDSFPAELCQPVLWMPLPEPPETR